MAKYSKKPLLNIGNGMDKTKVILKPVSYLIKSNFSRKNYLELVIDFWKVDEQDRIWFNTVQSS